MASFKKVSVERSTLIIPLIDNTDIVFILQPHLVKGPSHIFLLLDELSLKLFIQNSKPVSFSIGVDSTLGFFFHRNSELLMLGLSKL